MSSNSSRETVVLPHTIERTISLRSNVEAAIAPYTSSSNTKPPFTIAEIMVMAWVCREKQGSHFVSDEEVSGWMFTTFGYYRKMALKQLYDHSFLKCATNFKHRNGFQDLVTQRTTQCERIDVPLESRPSFEMGRYSSTLAGARRFLNRAIGGEITKFDGFFKLPVEIRVLIYEELFRSRVDELQYNDAEFCGNGKVVELRLSQRGRRSTWDAHEDWTRIAVPDTRHWSMRPYTKKGDPSVTESTSELLALLLVNRQIFEEAMPVFYEVNHFHAADLLELTTMLKHCGARRRPHFTSISVAYVQSVGPRTAIKAFKLLKDVKRLRRLEIETTDAGPTTGGYKPLDSSSVPQLPGFKILNGVRVRELHFTGTCPLIEAYLRQTMVKDSRGENKGGKGKSRKSAKARKIADTA